ncbi:hypothetical protein [Tanticharoenia sakaeratensis]|jgi:hypothetical protein|uniref:Uncharacterized protein n=1 Tax=Tanticharoenia sakaeratensis NBRC 103193 TaxID=1231623 RepID=A0A0D6MKG5_9PROT|nr:hypothetical protein [Tanticharoenia sakaeratensis]GAN54132.1 hypothetical protein Tasa_017_015 [Tanticharoenia sakaeratensis NBRC 103193]GBQ19495.1 hypothetical protein AA103193_1051 [Tanticharoenia sakaeratensis NBRC 103193]
MRAYHGQFSDNQPIRRNTAEKQKQLRDLKETLASMKSHTSPSLRESIRNRIVTLEQELRTAARKDEARAAEAATRQPRPQGPRRPRREF